MNTKGNTQHADNTLILLLSSIFLQSFSFLSIKFSTMQDGLMIVFFLTLAFIFLAMRAIVWQFLLKRIALSRVYPYASLVQILILMYSVFIFKESISITNIVGLIIMLSGIYYMSNKKVS